MKLSYLVKGLPGHPLHPPLTDVTIGSFTFAAIAALADVTGASDTTAAHGWWLALLVGLVAAALTATTGFIDWLDIQWGSPLWKTATLHMIANVTAVVLFGLAALFGHDDWKAGNVSAGEFILTVVGFGVLAVGGWLGGTITFVHGMRVLNLVEEPTDRAITPIPKPEKEAAEGG